MTTNSNETIIIAYVGELILKGRNRYLFEGKLRANLLANIDRSTLLSVEKLSSRFVFTFNSPPAAKEALNKLRKVFGVAILSLCTLAEATLEDIEKASVSCLEGRDFKSFAVRTKRVEKTFQMNSIKLNGHIGGLIMDKTGAKVDLENPEVTLHIETYSDRAYIYSEKIKGAGGLPTGTGGRLLCMISGGIDSPVAAWRMMKRGCEVDFIHFHSAPFTDKASIEKVEELCDILREWQCGKGELKMFPFGELQKKIVTQTNEKYRVILYRRFMVRIAEKHAKYIVAEALVTGESLGQVASQTLSNLATVDAVCGMPIFRPLIGMDKQEIVDTAREIGTYDLSIVPHKDCCQFFEPRNPVTHTTNEEMLKVEETLDILEC